MLWLLEFLESGARTSFKIATVRTLVHCVADLLTSSHPQMSASDLLGLQGPQQTPACNQGILKRIITLALKIFGLGGLFIRVTSLEKLSVAELSGEEARLKVYKNDHKNFLVIWLDLESNLKIWAHF